MVEAHESSSCTLPSELRQDWPVPWQPVWGERDGLLPLVEHLATRGLVSGLSYLPTAPRELLLGGVARLIRAVDKRHREAARRYLRQAFAGGQAFEGEDERVLQAYRHLLRIVVEGAKADRLAHEPAIVERYELDVCDDWYKARDAGRGTIVVGGHLGDWEAASALLPWQGFDPLYVFARAPKNRPMSKAVQATRERRGIRVLPRRGGMKDARAVIAAGGCLGLLLDQRARSKPTLAPLFGRPARCDRSAGVLLKRLGAPVLIASCLRMAPLRWKMVCHTVLWPEELSGASPRELATRVNQELERLILEWPDQYFWLHDRYRDTPLELPPDETGG